MALVHLKRLHKVKAKGRIYYYAWRGGPRIEAKPDTKEFVEEFFAHKNPTVALDRRKMATWIALFKASPEYEGFGKSFKDHWGPKLDDASRHFGNLSVSAFDKPQIRGHIKAWRDKWRETPRMADVAKQALSRLCSFIVEEGALATNPCKGIANVYKNGGERADIIWTQEDLATLYGCALVPKEIKWAARLAELTGLRKTALLELTWGRVGPNSIDMRGTKSAGSGRAKGRGVIPIYAPLRKLLDEMPRRALTVLTNTDGDPWKSGFGSSWALAVGRAGLAKRGLHFHDLRGTAATNFYVAVGLASRKPLPTSWAGTPRRSKGCSTSM